jgi:hypothetical protein
VDRRRRQGEMMRYVLLAAALVGCAIDVPPRPPADPDGCAPACERMRELGCPEGSPTPDGVACEVMCRDVQASRLNAIDTACLIAADSCAAAGEC